MAEPLQPGLWIDLDAVEVSEHLERPWRVGAVPRFFFDIRDCKGFHRDEVGDEFSGFEEAREQCQGLLPDIARGELPAGDLHTITCDLRDETDRVVYRGRITYEGTRDPE